MENRLPWLAISAVTHLVLAVQLAGLTLRDVSLTEGPVTPEAPMGVRTPPAARIPIFRPDPPVSAEPPALLPLPDEDLLCFQHRNDREGCGASFPESDPVGSFIPDTRSAKGIARIRFDAASAAPGDAGPITKALEWLARHQGADGLWRVTASSRCCGSTAGEDEFAVGVTGLAVLAFLRAGHTPSNSGAVRAGLQALVRAQSADGSIGPQDGYKPMYNHLAATEALAEAYRRSGSFLLEVPLIQAVGFLGHARNPGRAWRYTPRGGDNDSMVTGWAFLVLRIAQDSGVDAPIGAMDAARAWLTGCTEEAYGRTGYTARGWPKCLTYTLREFDYHETNTAMRLLCGAPAPAPMDSDYGPDLILRDPPAWGNYSSDFMYWHLASRAVRETRPTQWPSWRQAALAALLPNQHAKPGECREGSWDPVDEWSRSGGRVYATAMNALTLVVCATSRAND